MNVVKDYLSPVTKWWWLVITAPLIAALSAFLFVRNLPPVYQARASLLIGRAFQDPNPSATEFGLSYQLAGEYAGVATRDLVIEATKTSLGLPELPKYTASARGVFLDIAVIHTDPYLAQTVANELARQLVKISPTSGQGSNQEEQTFIQSQLKEVQGNIEKTRSEISSKQQELAKLDSALDIARVEDELKTLDNKMATLQSLYASLLASTKQEALNTISIFEPASLPVVPVGPNRILIILLAATSGLVFAVGTVYVIEFFDDTIKTEEDVAKVLDVPVLGLIADFSEPIVAYVVDAPRSPISDAFRSLRTNLEYSSVDHPLKRIVLTSPEASDGKTTVAINLALVLAQTEKKVVLIDADLRAPAVHTYLDLPNSPGLSDVFVNRLGAIDGLATWKKDERLQVLPAGSIPPNTAELLGSRKMDQILDEISNISDTVIIDSPPAFVVDSLVLSAKADGVILVVNSGETHRGALKAVTEQMRRLGANLVGIVMNRVPRTQAYYGRYYSSYYSKSKTSKSKKNMGWLSRIRNLRGAKKEGVPTSIPLGIEPEPASTQPIVAKELEPEKSPQTEQLPIINPASAVASQVDEKHPANTNGHLKKPRRTSRRRSHPLKTETPDRVVIED